MIPMLLYYKMSVCLSVCYQDLKKKIPQYYGMYSIKTNTIVIVKSKLGHTVWEFVIGFIN